MVKIYIKLLLIVTFIFLYSSKIWCIEENFIYFAIQKGKQDSTNNPPGTVENDTYLNSFSSSNELKQCKYLYFY